MPLATLRSPLSRLCSVLALAASLAAATIAFALPGDLHVTSDASDKVRKYNGTSGAYLSNFCLSVVANGQMEINFGATNGRALVGHNSGGIEEWDVASGTYIKTYNPTGGWQWTGLYAPTGEVYVGDMLTNDVRAYDANTGAFIRVVCSVMMPSDMDIGPDGNLYVCSWGVGNVEVFHGVTGAPIATIALPPASLPNGIVFHPTNNSIHVSCMSANVGYRIDFVTHMINGMFVGTGWGRPHGLAFSPWTGNLLVADGVTGQVHEFDPNTLLETNPAFLVPVPGDKIVGLAFEPNPGPTPARATTWGRVKNLFR